MNADLANKRLRRAEPFHWNDEIEQATGRAFNWRCPFCNSDLNVTGYHRSHINPVGSGIGVVPGNIVLACPDCNMDMHSRHTWTWCTQKGISYWQIQMVLEVIRRIFPIEASVTVNRKAKAPSPSQTVRNHLREHPEDIRLGVRELAEKLQVGKSTVSNVRRDMETTFSANGHGGE